MNLYSLEKQHKRGKLHVIERIRLIFDKNTFVSRDENGIGKDNASYDGVITGYGEIEGQRVYFYGQDYTYMGGTFGLIHCRQIVETIEEAIREKCPIIGLYDGGGARIQEGAAAVGGCGELFMANAKASGYIPQISIIAGTCAGGAVYSPGLTDFIFTIDEISNMFVTGAKVINKIQGTDYLSEELGSGKMHSTISGVSHFNEKSEEECYKKVRKLIGILPPVYKESVDLVTEKFEDKDLSLLSDFLPEDYDKEYDIRRIIYAVFDHTSFFEIQEEFAKNIVIGFAKLGGNTVGIVASQPQHLDGVIDTDGADKVSRFVNFCDAYNIPIITLVDSPGFLMRLEEEQKGLIRHGAKMIHAYANATTIKLTVILRKAYGGPYIFFGSKQLGADKSYIWPKASVTVMKAEAAVAVIYHNEVQRIESIEKEDYLLEKVKLYKEDFMNSKGILAGGFVDEELEPEDTRRRLYEDLLYFNRNKRKDTIIKKHGNMPV
jgi:acetyl-CoA carboxylase carboxyltransferase component